MPPAILYFAYSPGSGVNWTAVGWWSLVTVLLFSFVLVHELGHALMARNRGVRAERIILFPLGGGAYLPDQPKQLWAEISVYAAGPLANVLLAAIAYLLLLQHPDGQLLILYYLRLAGNLVVVGGWWEDVLGMTLSVNLLLAVGNLLPAYPLDGGRILRALLRGPLGKRPATVVVTALGVVIGLVLGWLSLRFRDPFLASGALFIVGLSVMEYRNGWQRRRLAQRTVRSVSRPVTDLGNQRLYPTSTVAEAKRLFDATGWPVLPVHTRWNKPLGFVEHSLLYEQATADDQSIAACTEPEFVAATAGENLLTVTERIVEADVYGAVLYGPRRRVTGYLFTEDVMRVLGK